MMLSVVNMTESHAHEPDAVRPVDAPADPGTPGGDAGIRLDAVPSFKGTWHDEADHTYIDLDTALAAGPFAYLAGFQLGISFQLFNVAAILAYALAFIAVVQAIEWCILQPLERRSSQWRR